jgi:hypothetical protein
MDRSVKLSEARPGEFEYGDRALATVVPSGQTIPNDETGLTRSDVVSATAAVAFA